MLSVLKHKFKPLIKPALIKPQLWSPLCFRSSNFSSIGSSSSSYMTVGNVLEKANEHRVEMVQLMFTDLHGTLQQLTITSNYLTESLFESGVYFDGSSIRGWQPIEASDMIIKPDVSTVFIDPFAACPTIAFLCDVYDPETKQNYHKDPRHVARKAVQRCKKSGICDHARIGPECEFYVFDNVSYSCGETNEAFYTVDSNEGSWTTGRRDSKGYKPRIKEGYFPGKPFDTLVDLRSEMVQEMNKLGLHVECAHHEVGAGGQCEIDFRFDEVIPTGDKVILYKYVVRNVAFRRGKTVTFMPKPLYGDNGSGMHQHYSLHDKDGKNLFTGDEYAGLSQLALYFIGGIMKHADALCAITNPTTNSYKRLVPGYEAPIYEAYSSRNRSAFIRIPTSHPKGRRIEYRTPDPCCNPYLSFAAIIQAGLDGIEHKISPGEPTDKNLYHMNKQEMLDIGVKHVPSSLRESIDALKNDNDFLKNDNVFTDDLIQTWIESKEEEITNSGCHPTPYEYHQYFDA